MMIQPQQHRTLIVGLIVIGINILLLWSLSRGTISTTTLSEFQERLESDAARDSARDASLASMRAREMELKDELREVKRQLNATIHNRSRRRPENRLACANGGAAIITSSPGTISFSTYRRGESSTCTWFVRCRQNTSFTLLGGILRSEKDVRVSPSIHLATTTNLTLSSSTEVLAAFQPDDDATFPYQLFRDQALVEVSFHVGQNTSGGPGFDLFYDCKIPPPLTSAPSPAPPPALSPSPIPPLVNKSGLEGIMVIVESRSSKALGSVISRFAKAEPNWDVMLVHGANNSKMAHQIKEGSVERLQLLQMNDVDLISGMHGGKEYTRLLTTNSFWSRLPNIEDILIFQTDAGICDRKLSGKNLTEFKKKGFSMIGAGIGAAGCGGLSLRRRSWMLKATEANPLFEVSTKGEDEVFSERLKTLKAPMGDQSDRDAFATEGTSDTRRWRPEAKARPWGCHGRGCSQYTECGWEPRQS